MEMSASEISVPLFAQEIRAQKSLRMPERVQIIPQASFRRCYLPTHDSTVMKARAFRPIIFGRR